MNDRANQVSRFNAGTLGRERAARVLEEFWDGDTLPVDPVKIARRMGATVWNAPLESHMSGVYGLQNGRPNILINQDDPVTRRRFTCAHELGHMVYDHFVGRTRDEIVGDVSYRDGRSSDGSDPEEIFANNFAAALLMPTKAINSLRHIGYSIGDMAEAFNINPESVMYRLKKL